MASKPKSFEEFYYLDDMKIYTVMKVDEYYERNNNVDYYSDKMFCPECKRASLMYMPKTSSKCSHLKRKKGEKHEIGCSYNYDYASRKALKIYINHLRGDRIQDKLNSVLKTLYKKTKINTENINKKTNLDVTQINPFLIKDKSDEQIKVKAIRRKRLDKTWIDSTEGEDLKIFYGIVRLEVTKKISKNNFKYNLLSIYTKNMNEQWRYRTKIYRGNIEDNVDKDKEYYIAMIGKVIFEGRYWKIDLINRSSIKFVETENL